MGYPGPSSVRNIRASREVIDIFNPGSFSGNLETYGEEI